MDFCFCYKVENQFISECTSQEYFSQNSKSNEGPYKSSEDLNDQILENQELSLYGNENYSLARNTFINIFPNENQSSKSLPLELLQIISEKIQNIGQGLQVFIPYSNDLQLLQYFIQNNNFRIHTIEDNQEYLDIIKKQRIYQQLQYISQDINDRFDLKIFNCCSQNEKRIFQLFQKCQINTIIKNQVFIFEYINPPHKIISQIMKDQETHKEELMTVSIQGTKKYYLFFTGQLSSTKNLSRSKTIEKILLEGSEFQTELRIRIKKMQKYLKQQKITKQEILRIIGSIQQGHRDELKKQQSDNVLQMFLSKIISNKTINKSCICDIFQPYYHHDQFTLTTNILQQTSSYNDFSNNQINSYQCANLKNHSRIQ